MTTIGKDLEKIRMAKGLTIEEVHHATKISISILLSIEDGSIFEDKNIANTYVRSYVRSFGRALKIDDELLIKALDQQETGNYNQLLLESYNAPGKESRKGTFTLDTLQSEDIEKKSPEPETRKDDKPASKVSGRESIQEETKGDVVEIHSEQSTKSPVNAVAAERIQKRVEEKDVDWANMGQKFHPSKKRVPVWPFLLAILVIGIGIAGYFVFQNIQSGQADEERTSELVQAPRPAEQDLSTDSEESAQVFELDEVLYITIYAAYGQLDPVRVWSDTKPRLDPYWIEQGTAMTFEFENVIRIRGQYSNFLVFKNGHLIDEPRVNHFNESENSVEISRDLFTRDSRWATAIPLDVPNDVALPDTVVSRPVFN